MGGCDTNCSWCTWNGPQESGKGTEGIGNQSMKKDHLDYSIVEISQNTQESPGDQTKIVVTRTPLKDNQQTLMRKKNRKKENNK